MEMKIAWSSWEVRVIEGSSYWEATLLLQQKAIILRTHFSLIGTPKMTINTILFYIQLYNENTYPLRASCNHCITFYFHFFVSETQFDRCLDQLFGIVLSPEDDAKLVEKYGSPDPKRRGMVSYRKFCEVIGAGTMIIYFLIFFDHY